MVKVNKEKMTVLGGALANALIESVLEANYNANPTPGIFPYIQFSPYLPPVDDWVPLLVAAPVHIAGEAKKNAKVEQFGRGMVIYAAGNLATVTTWRTLNTSRQGLSFSPMRQPATLGKYRT